MSVPTVKLREAAEINPRLVERPGPETPVSFLGMADVDAESGSTSRGEERRFSEVAKGYTQFCDGDLLVAKITPCFQNGKIAQAELDHPHGSGSTEFHVVRPDRSRFDDRFLLRLLRQPHIRVAGERRMVGSGGQRRVPEQYLAELDVPLFPLDEQRRIAETIDRADALRALRRRTIGLLDELARSIFLDMFGDPALNPRRWPRTRLGHLLIGSPQNGLYKPSSQYGSGTPIVRIDSFYSGVITKIHDLKRVRLTEKEVAQYRLRTDDLLINRVNSLEYLGKSAIVPLLDEPTVFESNMMRLTVDPARAQPRFVAALLQDVHVKKQISSAAKQAVNQASINQTDVKGLELYLPPLDLQSEFLDRLARLETVRAAHLRHLAELDALFLSVQHQAFHRDSPVPSEQHEES